MNKMRKKFCRTLKSLELSFFIRGSVLVFYDGATVSY